MSERSASHLSPGDGLHVAIIMDGNGRWATSRGRPRTAGHRRRRRGGAPDGRGGAGTWASGR